MSEIPTVNNLPIGELYTSDYKSLSPLELKIVADMALARGESWKLREIADHVHQLSEEYEHLYLVCVAQSNQLESKV
jgi:hypothetical protein